MLNPFVMTIPIRPHLRLALAMAAVLFVAAELARFIFMLWFLPVDSGMQWQDWTSALWLGARFDLRVSLVAVAIAWLLSSLPLLGKYVRPPVLRGAWWGYWMMVSTIWALGYISDAGHYAYLSKRLSATLLSLARDGSEATSMVWQSYPVIWIASGLVLWLLLCHWIFSRLWVWAKAMSQPTGRKWKVIGAEVIVVLLAIFFIQGKFSLYPLRWSDSIGLANVFAQQSSLNPLHNLYDTWTFREQSLDATQMRPDADEIRAFVGLPPLKADEPISFLRIISPNKIAAGKPPLNVVLVLLESFAAHKVGAFGSKMGATPAFDQLAQDGLLFTRMMSAHAHTARGVFATVTGIPDVSQYSTASRNPAATNQHTIINEFKNYKKYYFIGGSTSWANVRGILTANIDGVDIYEEGRLKSPMADGWGVSDKNLFLEANEQFRAQANQAKPFFAIIQTSGNHRPYNIPAEDLSQFQFESATRRRQANDEDSTVSTARSERGSQHSSADKMELGAFVPRTPSDEELQAQGFISLEEYRSFAYLDWCVGQFMQQARQENYFDNTIFAFIGDHGIIGRPGSHLPPSWKDLSIAQGHTPLLIYAPKHVQPRRINSWAQQVDVLPTLASLVGIGYRNTTLGRDLLDPQFDATRVAFEFQYSGIGEKGVLASHYLLLDRKPLAAFDILSPTSTVNLLDHPPLPLDLQQLVPQWSHFPAAYGNAALYLQTHNPRFHD